LGGGVTAISFARLPTRRGENGGLAKEKIFQNPGGEDICKGRRNRFWEPGWAVWSIPKAKKEKGNRVQTCKREWKNAMSEDGKTGAGISRGLVLRAAVQNKPEKNRRRAKTTL